MTKSKNRVGHPKDVYEMLGKMNKQNDQGFTYYEGIKIKKYSSNGSLYYIKIGNVVFVRSGDAKPYIAMIDELYKDKHGVLMCKATWFYRRNDVTKIHPTILDKVTDVRDNDLFFSKDCDLNLANLILNPCNLKFIYADNRTTKKLTSADFICSYRFNSANATIIRLKLSDTERYQTMQQPYIDEKSIDSPEINTAVRQTTVESDECSTPSAQSYCSPEQSVAESNLSTLKTRKDRKTVGTPKRKMDETTLHHDLLKINKKRRYSESSVNHNQTDVLVPDGPVTSSRNFATKSPKLDTRNRTKISAETMLSNEKQIPESTDEQNFEATVVAMLTADKEEEKTSAILTHEMETDTVPDNLQGVHALTGFQRMCELTRPQIIAKYSSSKVLSETEVVAILEQLWEGMDANERRSYLNPEYNPFKRDTASAEFDALGGTLDSDDSDMEQTRPPPKSSAVSSIEKESDDERDDDAEKMEGAKQPAMDPIMTRSRAQLDETYMRGSFVNDKSRAEQPKNPTRIGDSFQASIPELSLNPKSDLKGNGALLSRPVDFSSNDFSDYHQAAKEACYTVAMRLLAEAQNNPSYKIDGCLFNFSTPVLTLALETLNECHSDGPAAVLALEDKVRKTSSIWSSEEQKTVHRIFKKFQDNMPKLKEAVPGKTVQEILEYTYKYLLTAQLLEEDVSLSLKPLTGSKRNRPRPESEDENDEDEKRSEKAVDVVAAAGNGRAVTRGVTRGFKPPEKVSSHEPEKFISLARESLEDFSFIMVINSFIQLRKESISPMQLFVRVRNIIENSSASKEERESLQIQLLKLFPPTLRRFLNVQSITARKRIS